jgi:hypothetical protein
MRPPLTREEMQIVVEACVCWPNSWVPRDEALPSAERLVTRGLLTRKMSDGESHYFASDRLRGAAALHAALGAANASMN